MHWIELVIIWILADKLTNGTTKEVIVASIIVLTGIGFVIAVLGLAGGSEFLWFLLKISAISFFGMLIIVEFKPPFYVILIMIVGVAYFGYSEIQTMYRPVPSVEIIEE